MDHAPLRIAALSCMVAALSGCNPAREEADKPAVSPTSCADFVERICTEASHVSPICKSLQKAAEVLTPETCAEALTTLDLSFKKIADMRRDCTTLTERLCTDLGQDSEGCNTVRSTSKSYPNERCQQMLGQYAQVLDGLKQKAPKPAAPVNQEQIDKLASAPTSLAFGPADAKVSVVSVADFQDPYSARAMPTLQAIRQQFGERVRLVYRQFPQPQNRNGHLAAQAALAAQAQGKFWELHDVAFGNQSQLGQEALERYAAQVGLSVPKFKKALEERTYSAAVDADVQLAKDAGVERTPALFVNGQRIANVFDIAAVTETVRAALKPGS